MLHFVPTTKITQHILFRLLGVNVMATSKLRGRMWLELSGICSSPKIPHSQTPSECAGMTRIPWWRNAQVKALSLNSRKGRKVTDASNSILHAAGKDIQERSNALLAQLQIHIRGILFHLKCLWKLQAAKAYWYTRRHYCSLKFFFFATISIWQLQPNEHMLSSLAWVADTSVSGIREHLPLQEKMQVTKSQESSLRLVLGAQRATGTSRASPNVLV